MWGEAQAACGQACPLCSAPLITPSVPAPAAAAIDDLEQFWLQREQRQEQCQGEGGDWRIAAGGGSGSRPGSGASASPCASDLSLQRAYAQRARLLRDLEKAEGREAQRRAAAEQAARVAGQAAEEVRRLAATIGELDREQGWEGAAVERRFDPLDVHGAVAWQPAGTQRAPSRGRRAGSPTPGGRAGSPAGGCGSPGSGVMSPMSRRIMEAQSGSPSGDSFLDRLSRDIQQRQAAKQQRAGRAGRYAGGSNEQLAAQEARWRDAALVRCGARRRGLWCCGAV